MQIQRNFWRHQSLRPHFQPGSKSRRTHRVTLVTGFAPGQSLRGGCLSCLLASSILLMWKVVLSAAAFIDSSRPLLEERPDGKYDLAQTHTRLQFLEHTQSRPHTPECFRGQPARLTFKVCILVVILLSSYFQGLTWPGTPREAWASLLGVSVGEANLKWKHSRSVSSREAREFANGSVCLECDSQCERMDENALTCLGQVRTSCHASHLEKHHLVQWSWISQE